MHSVTSVHTMPVNSQLALRWSRTCLAKIMATKNLHKRIHVLVYYAILLPKPHIVSNTPYTEKCCHVLLRYSVTASYLILSLHYSFTEMLHCKYLILITLFHQKSFAYLVLLITLLCYSFAVRVF